jgi:Rrf2 family protein
VRAGTVREYFSPLTVIITGISRLPDNRGTSLFLAAANDCSLALDAIDVSFPVGKLHNDHMRLSARADYALRASIELAAAQDGHVTAEQLAQAQSIPGKFLETILTQLRRAGLVRSQRGPDGGFWLARPANEISLADIIRAIDGQLVGVRGERPENIEYPGAAAPLQRVWIALRANERAVLETVTLADVVSGDLTDMVQTLVANPSAWV